MQRAASGLRGSFLGTRARSSAARWGVAAGFVVVLAGCGDDGTDGTASGGGSANGTGGGGSTGTTLPGSGGSTGSGPVVTELRPDADPLPGFDACLVTITTGIAVPGANHVAACTPVDYATNPPSGGDHWGTWATFRTYDAPIPREMVVHDLEHGAIAMLHDCEGCEAPILAAFEDVRESHGADEKCLPHATVARFLTAPDPDLDHPVALAAWGATYVATCIDVESLEAFVASHYAKGPEDTCYPGTEPDTILCD